MVAVEPSADALGADLAIALRRRLGEDMRLVGVGGPLLAAQGLISSFDPRSLAVVGVFNALAAYPEVLRRARQTAALAAAARPRAAILIDAWGFNLRVAHRLRRVDPTLPLIKYVAPQVWATRPGRARVLAAAVDHLLTIHSFDAPYFQRAGLKTTFVGNPALNRASADVDPARLSTALGLDLHQPLLLLLPGSRAGEVDRLLPVFEAAVGRLSASRPDLAVVMALADSVADRIKARLAGWRRRPLLIEGEGARRDAMAAATVALACSGTVTTELALAGCPMVVAYRLGPLTHAVAKRLIRTPYISLINVAAGAFVAPERVQHQCNGAILAADIARLLDDPAARQAQIAAQTRALALMRGGIDDPVERAADVVIEILDQTPRAPGR
jgi:lipid-A-disaccharide synthase